MSSPRRSSYRRNDDRERDRGGGYTNDRGSDRGYNNRNNDRPRERRNEDTRQYDERDRERERNRDRDRYNSRSSRRSASPRTRHTSRSQSPSEEEKPKAKPNFGLSGLLAADTNTVKAVDGSSTVLKYNEPPEARKPLLGWRLYVFKGSEEPELLHIHRQSAYLIGRDRLVADIAVDHPSCSKQHAAIQYRYLQEKDEFGASKGVIKPFIIDLESTNGTHVNDVAIPVSRYYELQAGDVIKFGQSTREYVLLHDEAQ